MSDRTERNCDKCIHHTNGYCDSWDCKMQTVEDVKKEAVNEYVKTVVEELETDSSVKLYGSGNSDNYLIPINRAIEIVKHGGVSDDVCKWKLESDGEFVQNPHTNRLYSNEPSMKNVYCNTCGKKIKVVE